MPRRAGRQPLLRQAAPAADASTRISWREVPLPSLVITVGAAVMLLIGQWPVLPFIGVAGRNTVLTVLTLVLAPVAAFAVVCMSREARQKLVAAGWLFILWALVIVVVLYSPHERWKDPLRYAIPPLYFLVGSQVSYVHLWVLRRTMLVLCGIIALGLITIGRQAVLDMMTFQLTYRFGTEDDMLYTTLTTSRVLFFCAVVCLFALLFERQRWLRVASACGFLVFAVFGLACGQRGPVVGFLITCFFLLFFLPGRRRRLSIIFASLITVAAVIPFIAAHLPIIYMRFTGVGDSGRSTIQADLLSEPVSLFGHGIPRYYAHNIVLEFFHDSGLFGLAIFLVALLNAAKALVTSYQYTRSMELVFIMAAALYFLLLQQFSFNIFNAEQLWLALAMATAIATDIRRMRLQARPRTDVVSC